MSLFSSLRRFWHPDGVTSRKVLRSRRSSKRTPLDFESLEDRSLLSATPFARPTGFTPDSGTVGDGITNQPSIVVQGQGTPGENVNVLVNGRLGARAVVDSAGNFTSGLILRTGTYTIA